MKNCKRLPASKFLGIFAADSFTVRRRCNRLTSSFCNKKIKPTKQHNRDVSSSEKQGDSASNLKNEAAVHLNAGC